MTSPVRVTDGWCDLFVTARDGLRLYARDYGPRVSPWWPVICLPGLSRNAADFDELALHLATHQHRPRRVLAIDYRGRGRSEFDTDWRNYTPQTEAQDLLDVMVAAGMPHAAFVGTSRGGLVIMQLATLRPMALRAVVLNDIGAEIEPRGLFRIKLTLESMPAPQSWPDADKLLQRFYGTIYPKLDEAGWTSLSRKIFVEREGKPVPAYDPRLRRHLAGIKIDQPLSPLWPHFDALRHVPAMIIRGETSDILSVRTLDEMRARRPDLVVLEVAGEGHPPLLVEPPELDCISDFLTMAEM